MLILLTLIVLLIGFTGYLPSLIYQKSKLFSPTNLRAALLGFFALMLALFLLKMGLPILPALAMAIVATFALMERLPQAPLDPDFLNRILQFKHSAWNQQTQRQPPPPSRSHSQMTDEEARAILNVKPSASKKEIKQAHHALIIKNHPDHGGSSYLAAKINQARDKLL